MPFDLEKTDTKAIFGMSRDELQQYALACTEAMFDPALSVTKKMKLRERRMCAEQIVIKAAVREQWKK